MVRRAPARRVAGAARLLGGGAEVRRAGPLDRLGLPHPVRPAAPGREQQPVPDPAGRERAEPRLAALALCGRRLAADWPVRFGHPLLLLETFVDPARHRGTVYRAANWTCVGRTRGFRRVRGGYGAAPDGPKLVFVRPLVPDARARLTQPALDPADRHGGPKAMISADTQERKKVLHEQGDALRAQREQLAEHNALRQRIAGFSSAVRATVDHLDFEQRQKLLRLVVDQVLVSGWRIEIKLQIPLDEPPAPPGDALSSKDRLRSIGNDHRRELPAAREAPRRRAERLDQAIGTGNDVRARAPWRSPSRGLSTPCPPRLSSIGDRHRGQGVDNPRHRRCHGSNPGVSFFVSPGVSFRVAKGSVSDVA